MTTGIPCVYSECRNSRTAKGICHVNNYIHSPKRQPNPARPLYYADGHTGYCSYHWPHLDADGPGYCSSRFTSAGLALESLRLPMPSLDKEHRMNSQSVPMTAETDSEPRGVDRLLLRRPWLKLARLVWVILCLVTIVI